MENPTSTPKTARQMLDELGRDRVITRLMPHVSLERGRKSLAQAAWKGSFSAKWYRALKALCDESDLECPMHLFRFDPTREMIERAATEQGLSND